MVAIVKELAIAAAPGRVWGALTQPDEIGHWWTNDLNAKPEVGSLVEFRFGENPDNPLGRCASEPRQGRKSRPSRNWRIRTRLSNRAQFRTAYCLLHRGVNYFNKTSDGKVKIIPG